MKRLRGGVLRLTLRSIYGQSKSVEDTEKVMKTALPTSEGEQETYRVAYAVHRAIESTGGPAEDASQLAERDKTATQFIGIVTLRSLDDGGLPLPEHLTIPAAEAATTLTVEVGYMFLPIGWGKGYATESLKAVFEACRRARSFWTPYSKLYVRAIVNEENPASHRVMEKAGVPKRDVYEWTGKAVYLAGEWTERSSLHIYGMHLLQ